MLGCGIWSVSVLYHVVHGIIPTGLVVLCCLCAWIVVGVGRYARARAHTPTQLTTISTQAHSIQALTKPHPIYSQWQNKSSTNVQQVEICNQTNYQTSQTNQQTRLGLIQDKLGTYCLHVLSLFPFYCCFVLLWFLCCFYFVRGMFCLCAYFGCAMLLSDCAFVACCWLLCFMLVFWLWFVCLVCAVVCLCFWLACVWVLCVACVFLCLFFLFVCIYYVTL